MLSRKHECLHGREGCTQSLGQIGQSGQVEIHLGILDCLRQVSICLRGAFQLLELRGWVTKQKASEDSSHSSLCLSVLGLGDLLVLVSYEKGKPMLGYEKESREIEWKSNLKQPQSYVS